MSKINLQEPQRNRNATANFVNLIMTSTVHLYVRGTETDTYIIIIMHHRVFYRKKEYS